MLDRLGWRYQREIADPQGGDGEDRRHCPQADGAGQERRDHEDDRQRQQAAARLGEEEGERGHQDEREEQPAHQRLARGRDQERRDHNGGDQDRCQLVRVADSAREPARVRVRAELLRGGASCEPHDGGQECAAEVGAHHPEQVLAFLDRAEDDEEEDRVLDQAGGLDARGDRVLGPEHRDQRPRQEGDDRVGEPRVIAEEERYRRAAGRQGSEPGEREHEPRGPNQREAGGRGARQAVEEGQDDEERGAAGEAPEGDGDERDPHHCPDRERRRVYRRGTDRRPRRERSLRRGLGAGPPLPDRGRRGRGHRVRSLPTRRGRLRPAGAAPSAPRARSSAARRSGTRSRTRAA